MNSRSTPPPRAVQTHPRGYTIGDYAVDEVIDTTDRSIVYRCYKRADESKRAKYAVKRFHARIRHALMFTRPARLFQLRMLKSVNHPNVAKTLDLIERDGERYWAAEYVDGVPLNERVATGGRLQDADIVKLARGLLSAFRSIAELRGAAFITIDLRLPNVIVRAGGSPCIIDVEPLANLSKDVRFYADHLLGRRAAYRAEQRIYCVRFLGKCALRMALPPTPFPLIYQADRARLGELKRLAVGRGYDKDLIGLAVASVANPGAVAFADWERISAA